MEDHQCPIGVSPRTAMREEDEDEDGEDEDEV